MRSRITRSLLVLLALVGAPLGLVALAAAPPHAATYSASLRRAVEDLPVAAEVRTGTNVTSAVTYAH